MKKIFYSFALITVTLLMFSCGAKKDVSKQIIGKWEFVSGELTNQAEVVDAMVKKEGEDKRGEIQEGVTGFGKKLGSSFGLEFKEGGVVMLRGREGKWTSEGNIITVTRNDEVIKFTVNEISDNKLDMIMEYTKREGETYKVKYSFKK